MTDPTSQRLRVCLLAMVCGLLTQSAAGAPPSDDDHADDGHPLDEFPDEEIPLKLDGFPERPQPILELGAPFLAPGEIGGGFELPTGAVWQPSLLVFGTYRSALQTYNDGNQTITEWANNFDLFANLQLSGTERVLFGMRPFEHSGEFVGYTFNPDEDEGWNDEFSERITHLFFEGDFGEIFPGLDPEDSKSLDWGFSIGRQPINFQDGMLINDSLDGVGITRNTVLFDGGSDLRATFFWAWDDIDRNDNEQDGEANLFGLFNEIDFPESTLALDVVYVQDNDSVADGFFIAASAVQRIGTTSTTFRILNSSSIHEDTDAVRDGTLLFSEISWTPHHTDDIVYLNAFLGIDEFSSAARDPLAQGPLGRVGVLYEAVGLGNYGAPLGNRPDDSVGVAIGYQMFMDDDRRQIVFELGARQDIDDSDRGAVAAGMSFQQAIGRNMILRSDAFAAGYEDAGPGFGIRFEILWKF